MLLEEKTEKADDGLTNSQKIRLAIVDYSQQTQGALIALFNMEEDIEVVLIANNGLDLLAKLKVKDNLPHIILMGTSMPEMDGIEATEKVLQKYPAQKIIGYSSYDTDAPIMYMHGVRGFIGKSASNDELIKAIKTVCGGSLYLTDGSRKMINLYLRKIKLTENQQETIDFELANQLTGIELKILWHIGQFKKIKEIADLLCLSPHTINNHQAAIRKKLGLKGKSSLLQFAVLQLETVKYLLKIKS
jgi:DNA-binding NarL/FixJ family response regulator